MEKKGNRQLWKQQHKHESCNMIFEQFAGCDNEYKFETGAHKAQISRILRLLNGLRKVSIGIYVIY